MDEARHVLQRLERIEAMREAEAAPRELLAELRGLLHDGEAWLAAEGLAGTGAAADRLAHLGHAIDSGANPSLDREEAIDRAT
jgi:hypothetical protein